MTFFMDEVFCNWPFLHLHLFPYSNDHFMYDIEWVADVEALMRGEGVNFDLEHTSLVVGICPTIRDCNTTQYTYTQLPLHFLQWLCSVIARRKLLRLPILYCCSSMLLGKTSLSWDSEILNKSYRHLQNLALMTWKRDGFKEINMYVEYWPSNKYDNSKDSWNQKTIQPTRFD